MIKYSSLKERFIKTDQSFPLLRFLSRFVPLRFMLYTMNSNYIKYNNKSLMLDKMSSNSFDNKLLEWEIVVMNIYFDDFVKLEKDEVVFDLGANIGYFSLYTSLHDEVSKIVAFEPSSSICELLHDNINKNNLQNVINVEQYAVGEDDSEVVFSNRDDNLKNRVVLKEESNDYDLETVKMTSLDNYVEKTGIVPTFIKIDIEGFEEFALKGMEKTLKNYKPKLSIASYHIRPSGGKQHDILVEILEGFGYECYTVGKEHIYAKSKN